MDWRGRESSLPQRVVPSGSRVRSRVDPSSDVSLRESAKADLRSAVHSQGHPIWVPAFAERTRRDSSLLQPCLTLPAARWRPGFACLPPRSKVRGVAERRAAHRPDPRLATRARLAQRARLAALHRGVPVRPAGAGPIPTNPGPRLRTQGTTPCAGTASSSRTGRSARRAGSRGHPSAGRTLRPARRAPHPAPSRERLRKTPLASGTFRI
jgi:hypothetical protein